MIGSKCRGVSAPEEVRRRAAPAGAGARRAQLLVRSGGVQAAGAEEEWPELLGESPGVGLRELTGEKIGIMSPKEKLYEG